MIKNRNEKRLLPQNGNILYILNILKKYSDEDHILTVKDIIEKIDDEYDILLEDRTVRRNINLLIEKFNYDISTWNDNKKGYYLLKDPEYDFENGELRAIIYTFSYATFIDENLSKEIINKCKKHQNVYENEKIKDYKIYSNDIKTSNKEVIKNLEDIGEAIYEKRKITFDYYKYVINPNLKIEKVNSYQISPYAIVYSIQEFYVIGLKDGEKELYSYRIDRMKNINISDELSSKEIDEKKINSFIKTKISMYGGNGEDIEVICDNVLLDNVIEVFGRNLIVKKYDEDHFKLIINKDPEAFKYYLLRNIEHISIIRPESLKKDINKIIKDYTKR